MSNAAPSWDDLRILLAVYRDKSFVAAGKSLGIATSTVARRVDALEELLGRPVIVRSSGGARVDPDALGAGRPRRIARACDHKELSARGVVFTKPPTEEPYGFAAMFRDDSGNYFSFNEAL